MRKDVAFQLRIPEELKEWVRDKAKKEDRSMNNLIVRELRKAKEREQLSK